MNPHVAQRLIRRSRRGFYDFLKPGVEVRQDDPFTLEALEDGVKVKMYRSGSWTNSVAVEYATTSSPEYAAYKIDTSNSLTSGAVVSLNAGEKVSFIGNNPDGLANTNAVQYHAFAVSGRFAARGNLHTLVLKDAYIGSGYSGMLKPQEVSLPPNAFPSLFRGCSGLTVAPALPATTLADRCYMQMFYGCSGLTSAPALPATTLAARCYMQMFYGCTGLTVAPALPATTLAGDCYNGMFWGCSGLTSAPALPATTLADRCYSGMFRSCTGLTVAPALPATTLAVSCYSGMFWSCSGLTSVPALPATTLAINCYSDMFHSCSGIAAEAVAVLPAGELVSGCYSNMFNYAGRLDSIDVSFTKWKTSENCTTNWVKGLVRSGSFRKPSALETVRGDSGIPSGWAVSNK